MNKLPLKFVALLIIPCLILDPVGGKVAALTPRCLVTPIQAYEEQACLYGSQALADDVLSALNPLLEREPRAEEFREAGDLRQQSAATPGISPRYENVVLIILGITVGSLSQLLGVGGGLWLVPGLMQLLRMPAQQATATSLAAIAPMTILLTLINWKGVDTQAFMTMAGASIAGVFLGTYIKKRIQNETPVKILLAAVLAFTALKYLFPYGFFSPPSSVFEHPIAWFLAGGVFVGALSSYVGVGGGFLYVPLLYFLFGSSQHQAIVTSLAMVSVNSAVSARLQRGSVAWPIAKKLIVSSIVGGLIGWWLFDGWNAPGLNLVFGAATGFLSLSLIVPVLNRFFRRWRRTLMKEPNNKGADPRLIRFSDGETYQLRPGTLLHTVATSPESIPSVLAELAQEGFSPPGEGAPNYVRGSAFNFHVTGTHQLPAGIGQFNAFSINPNDRPIGLLIKPEISEEMLAYGIFSNRELKKLIAGSHLTSASLLLPRVEKAETAFRRKRIQLPEVSDAERVIRDLLYSIFVARFYDEYNRTGRKNYLGVRRDQHYSDGIVSSVLGVRGYVIRDRRVVPLRLHADMVDTFLLPVEVESFIAGSLNVLPSALTEKIRFLEPRPYPMKGIPWPESSPLAAAS